MTDNLTPEQRKKNMKNIRSSGTAPELKVAKELKRKKIYFAKNVKSIIGKPDFVFRRKKLVIFIDSDFWHGHPTRCIMPKSNRTYWDKKIKNNVLRGRKVNRELKKRGWRVIRIWEKDLKQNFNRCILKITNALDTF